MPVAADRRLDAAAPGARTAPHERLVAPLERVTADEVAQATVRLFASRHDQQAGRVAVDAVDDPRPVRHLASGDAPEEPVHERPRRMPGRRMHHDPGRLVHDEQVLVLVRDPERELLGLELARVRVRRLEDQLLAAREPVALGPRFAVEKRAALFQQPLRRRA